MWLDAQATMIHSDWLVETLCTDKSVTCNCNMKVGLISPATSLSNNMVDRQTVHPRTIVTNYFNGPFLQDDDSGGIGLSSYMLSSCLALRLSPNTLPKL